MNQVLPFLLVLAVWPLTVVWKRIPRWISVTVAGGAAGLFLLFALRQPEARYVNLFFAVLAIVLAFYRGNGERRG